MKSSTKFTTWHLLFFLVIPALLSAHLLLGVDCVSEAMEEESDYDNPLPNSVKIYCSVLLVGVFILGSVGNMLMILSIVLYSKLSRKVIHILLLPVSVCGFIIDILCVPTLGLHVVKYWPKWPLNDAMCTAVSFLTNTCTSMMVATMLLFSVDRFI